MKSVAKFVAGQLRAAGVERVYGLPGGENVVLLEAIRQQNLEFLLVKNESSACFMAATEARLTGKIGAALTTLGPGAANAYAGLAHCYLDRAPVLLITAAADPADIGRHTHQVLDLHAVFQPISKFSAELTPGNVASAFDKALSLARADRPGPIHLSLHNGTASQPVSDISSATDTPVEREPAVPALDDLNAYLAKMRKPIIVLGLGLEPSAPYQEVRRLAESLNAPVVDTPKSKGAISADHPLFAGTLGLTRHDPVYDLLDEADGIIAIGFDVVELVKPWDYQKPLIWLAPWANRDPRVTCALEIVGDIKGALQSLAEIKSATAACWAAARVRRFRDSQASIKLPRPRAQRILPQTFLNVLRANTPADIIVTTDVGSHKIFAALHWPARQPNRYFVSNGLSVMGFGLSSAIAAAEVTGLPTVCITGDAGLAMAIGELGFLVERQLPVLVTVMNDSALDLIRSAQHRQGRPTYGTEFTNPDFRDIARAYGLAYFRAESEHDCQVAIRHGLASQAPTLIDVMIDPIGYPTTMPNRRGS